MDKKGALLPMMLALGAATLYLLAMMFEQRQFEGSYQMGWVLAASADIPSRTLMKPAYVEPQAVPRKFMQQDAFEVKSAADVQKVADMVTRVRIPKGNQVLQSELEPVSADAGLSVKVPPGYRAMILPISGDLNPLVKPGDHVDVLVTFDALLPDNHKEKVTATILQNVMVLAVGTNMGQGMHAGGKSSAKDASVGMGSQPALSLALNPNEAQYLALAMKEGDTSVIVRGLGDFDMHPMEMASFRRLFSR